jgi:hypothetical protein
MSPHHDAPSPANSFTHSSDFHQAVQSIYTMDRYNDFETSSMESGDVPVHRSLVPGIYVPTVAFFDPATDNVDVETIASHAVRLAKAGVAGITTQGSNGEAVHLSHKERNLITNTTRKALVNARNHRIMRRGSLHWRRLCPGPATWLLPRTLFSGDRQRILQRCCFRFADPYTHLQLPGCCFRPRSQLGYHH